MNCSLKEEKLYTPSNDAVSYFSSLPVVSTEDEHNVE